MNNHIHIYSQKYDQLSDKKWSGEIIYKDAKCLQVKAVFDKQIDHALLGTILAGTVSLEYFWFDKGFNIFVFFNPDKSFRNFYCNITSLPKLIKNNLEYIDLDIDVLVEENLNYRILDFNEFLQNSVKYSYSQNLLNFIIYSLFDLLNRIETRQFPFDKNFI